MLEVKYAVVPVADRFQVHQIKETEPVGAEWEGEYVAVNVAFTTPLDETFATREAAVAEVEKLIEIYGKQ